jgi:hypothetical protein
MKSLGIGGNPNDTSSGGDLAALLAQIQGVWQWLQGGHKKTG